MDRFKQIISLDLRSLAAFRLGMGGLLMLDIVLRATDLAAHYTDFGILPRAVFLTEFANKWHISLHLAGGTLGFQLFMFGLAFLFAFFLCVGYRTRLASIISWILLISLHSRNPNILNGGDVLFRQLLFWGMFLPLGARYSIDAALRTTETENAQDANRVVSGATLALTLQFCVMYLCTALFKTGSEWWPDGTASYYALSLDQFTIGFGQFLLQFPQMLQMGTYFVFFLEWAAAFLILCPVFHVPVRMFVLLLLMGMHFNFDIAMRIGIFPWIDIFGLCALLPGWFWEFLGKKLMAAKSVVVIHYDRECDICLKLTRIISTFCFIPFGNIKKAQDSSEINELMQKENSWVVEREGQRLTKMHGLLGVAANFPVLGSKLFRLAPFVTPMANPMYSWFAKNRPKFSGLSSKLLPFCKGPIKSASLFQNCLVVALSTYMVAINLDSLPNSPVEVTHPLNKISSLLRLDQKWNMFAPYPLKDDGWFVIPGKLRDGTEVDVFHGLIKPVSFKKPKAVAWEYKNARWRKYILNLWQKKYKKHRLHYGKYLCRSWNDGIAHDRQLLTFQIHYMLEKTPPPGLPTVVDKRTIWRHNCFKKDKDKSKDK